MPSGSRAKLKCCEHATVCPWCWSRLVVKRTFDQVVATLAKLGETFDPAAPGLAKYKLIATVIRGVEDANVLQPKALLDWTDSTMRRTKLKFAKVAAGSALLGVVAPSRAGWVYSIRALALVPRDYPTKVTKPKTPEYTPLTKRSIARAVARFARYPKGMLTGDLGRTMRLLELRGDYRLLRFGGVFTKLHGRGDKGPPARYLDL